MTRLRILLNGTVQGVGFRPFVYRTARTLGLKGYVTNDTGGVVIEVEGAKAKLDDFLLKLHTEKPPLAKIYYEERAYVEPAGYDDFRIEESISTGPPHALILPDISTCGDCTGELLDPDDRRYLYPFINCTNCGPRFTIIKGLPYDRPNTTMKDFHMCPACENEYKDPDNRRFHAQPNACPECGPNVRLVGKDGAPVTGKMDAITSLMEKITSGAIVAVKGIGGFHLICDATSNESVRLLRERKGRTEKPFAVMFRDMEQLKRYALPDVMEESLLLSPARPVVIVRKKQRTLPEVSPRLEKIGAFLPYSPLHLIILAGLENPVVATSGNISDEPIVRDNAEALDRLSQLADFIMLHNRPIHRRCDDSVVKVVGEFPQVIRRSRGHVPLPVVLPFSLDKKVLAVGAHEKNTVAIGFDNRIILSQHIGDMETPESIEYFEEVIDGLSSIYEFTPDVIVHDLHPRYSTTRWAIQQDRAEIIGVQHHYAHILSCMAENGIYDEVTGISWDGTGYGEDGTLWGGEFLACNTGGFQRRYHFRQIRLLGGEKAVREPRRIALAVLFDIFNEGALEMDIPTLRAFDRRELSLLWLAYNRNINTPVSSSVGRLFDALSSLLGILQICSYEAQAAMLVEDLYDPGVRDSYGYELNNGIIDWEPLFRDLLEDSETNKAPSRFLNTLALIALNVALLEGREKVCLSGGVFQNSPLTSLISGKLQAEGFRVFTHKNIPANDGGISLGQALYGGMNP